MLVNWTASLIYRNVPSRLNFLLECKLRNPICQHVNFFCHVAFQVYWCQATVLETRGKLCVIYLVPTHSKKESTRLSFPSSVAHFLTPWSRVLKKLRSSQLVKKFPTFYGTRRFITAFTSARHLSLSRASSIQSMPLHPTS